MGEAFFDGIRRKRFLVEDNEDEREFFLAARFYTGRVLSMEAIAKTLKLLWRTRKGFEVVL